MVEVWMGHRKADEAFASKEIKLEGASKHLPAKSGQNGPLTEL